MALSTSCASGTPPVVSTPVAASYWPASGAWPGRRMVADEPSSQAK
jgi:hypothetical protein